MLVYVFHDARFYRTPDGNVWTKSKADQSFWNRYFDEFTKVVVVARVFECEAVTSDYALASQTDVQFCSIGTFRSKKEFVFQYPKTFWELIRIRRLVAKKKHTVIFRVPLSLSYLLPFLGIKYGVEVVGDPYDAFSINTSGSKTFFLKWYLRLKMRFEVLFAAGGSFVTDYSLQKRYPLRRSVYHTSYSSIDFQANKFWDKPFPFNGKEPFRMVCVGSLEHLYKGPDVVIEALKEMQLLKYNFHLTWIGDGKLRNKFIEESKHLGLEKNISFVGFKTFDNILQALQESHLFVLASRQEGLPRAMIEAMTQSLCCVGTSVGGVEELIDNNYVCEPGNVKQLQDKIIYCLENERERLKQAEINFQNSKRFESKRIQKKRNNFYSFLKGI